ncbi:hypothetical protein [Filimonas effusa]|uniref:Uncharacterized protein n=1 Tax=Filimonas effusa TaxID=2508721 RepID=A0A4Q1D416_9BACT|nr:hypothetical protein [Filimonas effusa]RXK81887.1 hypothetical protein ESB13_19065 [Filimonas effusa]
MKPLLAIAFSCLLLASCSKDKSPVTPALDNSHPLIGTWQPIGELNTPQAPQYGVVYYYPENERSYMTFTQSYKLYIRNYNSATVFKTIYKLIPPLAAGGDTTLSMGEYNSADVLPSRYVFTHDTMILSGGSTMAPYVAHYYKKISSDTSLLLQSK